MAQYKARGSDERPRGGSRQGAPGARRRAGEKAARLRAVDARLGDPQPNLIPARGQLDREGRIALFCAMAEKVSATVRRARSG